MVDVGFPVALALGWTAFEELLEGGAEMDRHFRLAEPRANAPLLAAFADLLYTQKLKCQTRAVFAYDERLRLLPTYLQQLEMESNGKSVTADGKPLGRPSAPVTWGGVGTDAQHAVFQLLHQGTQIVPVEFVAVIDGDDGQDPEHHRQLLLNCLRAGRGADGRAAERRCARALMPGDRPSSTMLLDRLDPRTLGALIAFYEHRTFANAVLLGINPFDQFGVELGKQMARAIGDPEEPRAVRCVDPRTDRKGRGLSGRRFDLVVIGAGSGGVRAARVAAGHGAKVAIAEEHKVGGTCVIRGCVPKKLLVYGAHFAEDLNDAAMFGWDMLDNALQLAGAARQCAGRGDRARGALHRDARQVMRSRSSTSG